MIEALGTIPVGVEVRLRTPGETSVAVLSGEMDIPLELTSDPAGPYLHDGGYRNQEGVVLVEFVRWLRDTADYIETEGLR